MRSLYVEERERKILIFFSGRAHQQEKQNGQKSSDKQDRDRLRHTFPVMTFFSIAGLLLISAGFQVIHLTSGDLRALTALLHCEYMLYGLHWVKPGEPGEATNLIRKKYETLIHMT